MGNPLPTADIIEPITEWLKTCDSRHIGSCVESNTSSTKFSSRPYRLIDVEEQCIVRGNVQGEYLALSYVWQDDTMKTEDQQQFQLSLDNADSLTAPNSMRQYISQLPKTIRDAMELTIAIQKRYLWVDRLCIVQDHPRKEEEFMRMDQIYSGAYMTIVAAAKHGMYCNRGGTVHDPALASPNDWFANFEIPQHLRIRQYYGIVSRSKWAKRAWTYQEYILSKRVIFFLDTRIFWQCECTVWDKDHLQPKQDMEAQTVPSSTSGHTRSFSVPSWPDFGLYADLICPYNGRDLSYDKDGLSACLGILNRLAPAFPSGFLFGLPRIYLDYALLWQPLSRQLDTPECKALADGCPGSLTLSSRRHTLPSWAWCGWQCFVDPRSFQAALNLGGDSYCMRDTTSSWKLCSIITWEYTAASKQEPFKFDEPLQRLRNQTQNISSLQSPLHNGSGVSTHSNHISALAMHASFFPAATLEIRFQEGWQFMDAAGLLGGFANPVLSEKDICKKPRVVVLRDSMMRFSGLLCITGNSDCKRGEPMELVAISRGSANGKDLRHSFEERVFAMSRYRDAKAFRPVHDDEERWIGVEYITPSPGESHHRVVATGDYEIDLKVSDNEYMKDQVYDFYNVLWVQHGGDGIMYRAGCGRILTEYWEANNPVDTWITLG
ncbi:heterokaryon incompatibility protein [Paraphaeosphaeria sporulosa]